MAAIQTCALITVMMGFLASTTFNKEFFRHRIIIIHCVLILLLLESRRLLQRENGKSKALLGETNIHGKENIRMLSYSGSRTPPWGLRMVLQIYKNVS